MSEHTTKTTRYGTVSSTSLATNQERDRSPRPGKFSALALVLLATICVVIFHFHGKNALRAKNQSSFMIPPSLLSYAPQKSSFSLLLLRHAKSSWEDPDLSDEQRPLNSKGINDAQRLGAFLMKHEVHFPDMILASPSVRTRQTLKLVQSNNWAADVSVEYDERLYTLAMTSYVDFCRQLDPYYQRILLVGHNPAMQNTGRQLLRNKTLRFPPGSFLEIELENATDWHSVDEEGCKLGLFVTPNTV